MLLYKVADDKTITAELKDITLDRRSFFGFMGYKESGEVFKALNLSDKAVTEAFGNKSVVYENRKALI